jgi:hypothetical protein
VVVAPFASFLVSQQYPVARVETLLALAWLAAATVILARLCRRLSFYILLIGCGGMVAAVPLQRALSSLDLFSSGRAGASPLPAGPAALLALALLAGLALLLRQKLFHLVTLFAACMLLLQVAASVGERVPAASRIQAPPTPPAHFLYVVLDEHIGPAGLPEACEPCRAAEQSIQLTFRRFGFRLYPFAYANFTMTLDSVPSILSGRIPSRQRTLLHADTPDSYGIYHVNAHSFFEQARSKGYDISIWQYRGINFARGETAKVHEYGPRLGVLSDVPGSWKDKFRFLVGTYQNSDAVFSRVNGFFPFRFGFRLIGPLCLVDVREKLLSEVVAARRPTFFFVHFLTPHAPYLYREDGSIRQVTEWIDDSKAERLPSSAYLDRYARYAGQVEFEQLWLRQLLAALEQHGLLEAMTVVVHGDHGSRIRRRDLANLNLSVQQHLDRYDHTGPPDLQDLLDRFSALLAFKAPHQLSASLDFRKASIVRILSEDLYGEDPAPLGPAADEVFLFDEDGNAQPIPLLELWN